MTLGDKILLTQALLSLSDTDFANIFGSNFKSMRLWRNDRVKPSQTTEYMIKQLYSIVKNMNSNNRDYFKDFLKTQLAERDFNSIYNKIMETKWITQISIQK